jgi:hypothetical protein
MLKFKILFFESYFILYIFLLFHRNQKIYILHFVSNFVTSLKFYKNVIFISCSILFSLIIHLLVNLIYTSYTTLFEILIEMFKSNIFDDFRLNYYNYYQSLHKFMTQNDWLYSKMIKVFLTWLSRINTAFDCMIKIMTIRTSFLSWWYFDFTI